MTATAPLPQTRAAQAIRIFQICYSPETLASIPAGFSALDNTRNERPDWREYWHIRQYLLSHTLEENTLYGFFSPKFPQKTGLDLQGIQTFIDTHYHGEDVVFFSPFWDLSSFFLNVFEQADFFHDGIQATSRAFIKRIGGNEASIDRVMHSRNTIFCNYFLAGRKFWMKWLELGERLFAAAESTDASDQLTAMLNAETRYGKQRVPRKVFVMERLASLLVAADPTCTTCPFDTFRLAPSATPLNQHFHKAVSCDALKRAWMDSGSASAISTFMHIRDAVLKTLTQPAEKSEAGAKTKSLETIRGAGLITVATTESADSELRKNYGLDIA